MSSSKSTAFVLIAGGFCPAAFYHKVTAKLHERGYDAYELDLPSVGRRPEGPAQLSDDVECIQSFVAELADQGRDVVVAANSYGGFPATEAVQGITKSQREALGKSNGLVHLVFLASLFAPVGITCHELVGAEVPVPTESARLDFIERPDPELRGLGIFSDLDASEQLHYAKQMKCHSPLSFAEKITYPGYLHVPTTAVVSDNDQCLSVKLQHDNVDAAVAKNQANIRKVVLDSDHCSMISHPDDVVRVLLEAAAA